MPARLPLATLLLVALTTLFAVGCGGSDADSKEFLVIFCQADNAEPYRAAQNARFKELFDGRDDVEFVIYDAQSKDNEQVSQIEQAIKRQPDLLIVAPLNNATPNDAMKAAMEADIKVICLERQITGNHQTTYIGSDNAAIGRLAGEFIVKALTEKNGEPKGKLIEITGSAIQAMKDRHNGAFEVLQPYIDEEKIEVIYTADGDWKKNKAMDIMTDAYSAKGGDFDVVYAHNDPMAHGAYLIAKEKDAKVADEAIFVGIDGLPDEGVKWVKSGELDVTFEYPLCVDKAFEVGMKMLDDETFKPEPEYILKSRAITGDE